MIYDTFKTINTFIFDVDGVLTTGKVLAQDDGSLTRDFNIKDGFAIQFAVKQNYRLIIISGGSSEGVINRLKRLGIQEVYTGVSDKRALFETLIQKHDIALKNTLYMGDDFLISLPCECAALKHVLQMLHGKFSKKQMLLPRPKEVMEQPER